MRPIALDRRTLLTTGAVLLGLAACGSNAESAIHLVSSPVRRRTASPASVGSAVGSVQHLTGGLYHGLSAGAGNLAFSPLSVAAGLAMTVNGAVGRTRAQMLDVLGTPDADVLDEGMNGLLTGLQSLVVDRHDGDDHIKVALDIADAVFAQRGITWKRAFLDELSRDYGAGVETVDFGGDPDGARSAINAWTSDHTAGLIRDLLAPGTVTADTRLVLVNALHLLASWATEFGLVSPGDFHLASGEVVRVPRMTGGAATAYQRGDGWQAALLPYRGAEAPTLAMTVVLPDPGRLPEVEAFVAAGRIDDLIPRGGSAAVTMPAWSVTTSVSLRPLLAGLGMGLAFDGGDFSAMTADEPLELSDVVHQAVVKVDQHGTEAAAATAVVVMGVSGTAVAPVELVVDRPFLFLIHDIARGTPLFVGRVADPRQP